MWRRLIYVVCTVKAGVLAAILAALVIDPSLAAVPLTPAVRRLCALTALVLMLGSGYAAMCLLSDVASWAWGRITARSGEVPYDSGVGAVDLAEHQLEQGPRSGRDRRAA